MSSNANTWHNRFGCDRCPMTYLALPGGETGRRCICGGILVSLGVALVDRQGRRIVSAGDHQ